jgi:phage gpG-like protein
MIGMQIIGSQRVITALGDAPVKVNAAVKSSLDAFATELAGYIKAEKLSGDPLHRRSGRLSASVHPVTEQTGTTMAGGAGGGAGVPYAQIHEFGGVIPAHEVVVRNAKALCFTVDGVRRFATRVQIPDVQMPERSYMRSAFDEQAPSGMEQLRAAVKAAIAA